MRTIQFFVVVFFVLAVTACQGPSAKKVNQDYLKQYQDHAGALTIDYYSPTGSILTPQNKIVIHFSQPMVPLTVLESTKQSDLVTITPQIEGYFKWVNSRTLVFQASADLPFATTYKVTVRAGRESLLGFALLKDFEFSFGTPRPDMVTTDPVAGAFDVSRKPVIGVSFNQAVSYQGLTEIVELSYVQGHKVIPTDISCFWGSQAQTQGATQGCTRIELKPKEMLEKDVDVQLLIRKGLRSQHGPDVSESDKLIQFRTHGDFDLTQIACVGPCTPNGTYLFHATTKIASADFEKFVFFDPPIKGLNNSYKYWSDKDQALSVPLSLQPNTTYQVTVNAELKDVHGQELGQRKTFELKTEHHPAELIVPYVTEQIVSYAPEASLGFDAVNVRSARARFKLFGEDSEVVLFLKDADYNITTLQQQPNEWNRDMSVTGEVTDKRQHHTIRMQDVLGARNSGIVLSLYTSPEVLEYDYTTKTNKEKERWLLRQITDLAVDVKMSKGDGLVWTTSVKTAKTIGQTKIFVYDQRGQLLFRTVADGNGFARLPGKDELKKISRQKQTDTEEPEGAFPLYVFAHTPTETAFVSTSWGDDLAYGYYYDEDDYESGEEEEEEDVSSLAPVSPLTPKNPVSVRTHLLTDRGLYKPGEEVHIKGYARKIASDGLFPYEDPLTVTIRSPQEGEEEINLKVTPNKRGNFSVKHQLASDAALGAYDVGVAGDASRVSVTGNGSFQVQEFRVPEFKVGLTAKDTDYFKGDPVGVTAIAEYLFGAPMAEALLDVTVYKRISYFWPPNDQEYQFGRLYEHRQDDQEKIYSADEVLEEKLDAQGYKQLSIASEKEYVDPVSYEFGVTVYDVSKQSQSSAKSLIVHPAQFYIGAKLDQLFYDVDKPVSVRFGLLSPQGKTVLGNDVTVDLMRVKWVSVKRETLNAQYENETRREEERVGGCVKKAEAKNNECTFTTKESGYYFVKLTSQDAASRAVITEIPFYASGTDYSYWSMDEAHGLELVADKGSYEFGDTAKVLIKSPYPKTQALIAVERDRIMSYEVKLLEGTSPVLDIPIKKEYAPNVYVSVVLLKGSEEIDPSLVAQKQEGQLTSDPLIKAGKIELNVKPYQKNLDLEVRADRASYHPGDTVTVSFKLKDFQSPEKAEITVMAVDEGVLLAGGYQLANPLDTLYEYYEHGVALMDSRTRFVGKQGAKEKLEEPSSGGGQMDGYRQKFIPLAYYNDAVETDENGQATVSFVLPDQLTSFKVMAIANAQVDQFGLGETTFKTSKEIMIRPALPRFIRDGDHFESDVAIHNQTNEDLEVTLSVDAVGLEVTLGAVGKITVPAQKTAVYPVAFTVAPGLFEGGPTKTVRVAAEKTAQAKVVFDAKTKNQSDQVIIKLPVYQERLVETVASSGALSGTVTEVLEKSPQMDAQTGGMELSLSTDLLTQLSGKIKLLKQYPYDCLEQRMSKVYPLVLFAHEDFLFEDDYRDPVKRFGVVATFIKRLSREQNYRGGFAFWSSSLESPTLTLMVAEFLIEAREAGHEVDALLEKTKGHILNTYLRDDAYDLREFNKEYRDKLKIHALYVLHKLGQPQPSRYGDFRHNLFEKDKVSQLRLIEMLAEDEQYQPLVQAWLKEQNNLIRLKGETAVVDDPKVALDGYYFGYSSRAQTARLARLLINVEPSHPLLFPLLMGLTQEKSNRQYISSLETLEVLQALKAYQKVLVAGREPVIATIRMNDRELLGRIDPKKNNQPIELPLKTLPDRMNLQIVKDSGDVLFYDMKFHYALKEFRDWGLEQGITLTREYFDLKGIAVTPKDFLHGKTYKVVLNFFFADEADFLVVEEPLAAGVEPVNFALQTSRWGLQRQVTNTQPTLGAYLDHREFRDKKILLFAGFVPRGFYEFTYFINVTNRGQFMTPPAKAMEMYSPEIFGTTGKEEVRVK